MESEKDIVGGALLICGLSIIASATLVVIFYLTKANVAGRMTGTILQEMSEGVAVACIIAATSWTLVGLHMKVTSPSAKA